MAQVGPDYTYNSDTTVSAATRRKIAIIARKNPQAAATVASILGVGDGIPGVNLTGSLSQAVQSFDPYLRNLILTQFAQEIALASSGQGTQGPSSGTNTGVFQPVSDSISNFFDQITLETGVQFGSFNNSVGELMKPVSDSIGSTLGTLTGMARDPLGSLTRLPQTLLNVVESISPELAGSIEGFFKSEKIGNLSRLPGLVLGSVKNLISVIDFALALPAILLSDLYNFLADIMNEIANLIDSLMTIIFNAIFGPDGFLDQLFPISEVLAFLDAISGLAADIQGITTAFLGPNQIAGWAFSVQNWSNSITNVFKNPLQTLNAYLPSQVRDTLFTLRNPAQLVNRLIPPEIGNLLGSVQQITGVGLNGNMGYGFLGTLEAFKGGIISNIIRNFANQYPMLGPLLNLTSPSQPYSQPVPAYLTPVLRTLIAKGIIQPQDVPRSVFAASIDKLANRSLPSGT